MVESVKAGLVWWPLRVEDGKEEEEGERVG
jgi:hypothetical protein